MRCHRFVEPLVRLGLPHFSWMKVAPRALLPAVLNLRLFAELHGALAATELVIWDCKL